MILMGDALVAQVKLPESYAVTPSRMDSLLDLYVNQLEDSVRLSFNDTRYLKLGKRKSTLKYFTGQIVGGSYILLGYRSSEETIKTRKTGLVESKWKFQVPNSESEEKGYAYTRGWCVRQNGVLMSANLKGPRNSKLIFQRYGSLLLMEKGKKEIFRQAVQ